MDYYRRLHKFKKCLLEIKYDYKILIKLRQKSNQIIAKNIYDKLDNNLRLLEAGKHVIINKLKNCSI